MLAEEYDDSSSVYISLGWMTVFTFATMYRYTYLLCKTASSDGAAGENEAMFVPVHLPLAALFKVW